MRGIHPSSESSSKETRLMLFLASAVGSSPDEDLEACALQMHAELNESAAALQGPLDDHECVAGNSVRTDRAAARIVRPGNALEYRDSAMVGWRPLR